MQAAETYKQEPYEVPEGGLASFLTATSGSWSDEALKGPDTEYTIHIADQLAKYGREEDTELAHVAPGETVVPLAVLDADPDLKNRLFAQMRDLGLEPERYVVGNELNSINPDTGRPEFFLKKIFKGIKKAVKGVVKVFKKLAPIILPIALSFIPGIGAIAAGALGSGIGTLVQGGSMKDAFKAALLGGAMGGLSSGIAGVAKGHGFVEGLKGGLPGGQFGGAPSSGTAPVSTPDPTVDLEAITATPTGAESVAQAAAPAPTPGAMDMLQQSAVAGQDAAAQMGLPGGQLAPLPTNASPTNAAVMQQAQANAAKPPMNLGTSGTTATATGAAPTPTDLVGPPKELMGSPPGADVDEAIAANKAAGLSGPATQLSELLQPQRTFFDKIKDGDFIDAFRGQRGVSKEQIMEALAQDKHGMSLSELALDSDLYTEVAEQAATIASTTTQPGMLAQYGPMAGLGLGLMYAAGGFDAPEMDELPDFYGGMTGQKLLDMYPNKYGVGPISVGPYGAAAAGGGVARDYPRMNGAIYGPGTETSDDVPAMLSDGEFVMTARAVRGAGGGDRERGMQNMYRIMRDFERGASRG